MFHNRLKIRSLSEELMDEGLNPDKVLGEIDKNIAMMEAGPNPVSVSGLPAGDESPRTLGALGATMVEDAPKPTEDPGVETKVEADLSEEELEEALKLKKMLSKAKRAMKRKGAKYKRKLRKARIYARRNKAKIKRSAKKFLRKVGGWAKLKKKRAVAKKGNKQLRTGLDVLSNLAEELEASTSTEIEESTNSPYMGAVIDAGWLCHMLGDIFECYGDERAAEALFRVGDFSADLSESLESLTEDEDLDEDQEAEVKRVLEAAQKALSAWEELGSPTLPEAIEYAIEQEGDEPEAEPTPEVDED